MEEEKLKKLAKCSIYNKDSLEKSDLCGCYYCGRIYSPKEIVEWTDGGQITAICPHCGIDTVLAAENEGTNLDVLEAMHQYYFLQGSDSAGNRIEIKDRRRKKFNE